jgi:hypothetical protein
MNTDRIKEIQLATAHTESGSVYTALLKVWNETEQEQLHIGAVRLSLLDNVKQIAFGDGSAQERMVEIKALLSNEA